MAFCAKCGSSLGQGAQFCVHCGTPVAAAPAAGPPAGGTPRPAAPPPQAYAPPPQPYAAPPAAGPPAGRQGSSTALKIVLAIVGFFVLVGCLGIGSCIYVTYRVRKKMNNFAQSTPYRGGSKDPCRLITQAEVADALGTPVQPGTAFGDRTCQFAQPGGAILNYDVTWEGGTMALKIMTMALKARGDASTAMSSLPGLGDEAYIGPMGMGLFMRKGDVLVMISERQGPFNLDAAKKIASIIATRI